MRARLLVPVLSASLVVLPFAAHAQQLAYLMRPGETREQALARVSRASALCKSVIAVMRPGIAVTDQNLMQHCVNYLGSPAVVMVPPKRLGRMSKLCAAAPSAQLSRHPTHYYVEDGMQDWGECMQDQVRDAQRR